MSHMHQLGRGVDAYLVRDGQSEEQIYSTPGWENAQVTSFVPPLRLRAGDRIRWVCHYQNDGAVTVRNGPRAADEMCGVAGYYAPGVGPLFGMDTPNGPGCRTLTMGTGAAP